MCLHALDTVHALPDLRVAAGRFAGRFHQPLVRNFKGIKCLAEKHMEFEARTTASQT